MKVPLVADYVALNMSGDSDGLMSRQRSSASTSVLLIRRLEQSDYRFFSPRILWELNYVLMITKIYGFVI